MERHKLGDEVNSIIVDGINKGYLDYLEERREKQKSMNVSGAYAWTRGNHIDHQISKMGENRGLDFSVKKAGYSWEYLEFKIDRDGRKSLLIVKNNRPMDKIFRGNYSNVDQNNYLIGYANLNDHIFEGKNINFEESIQLNLELDSREEIKAILSRQPLKPSEDYDSVYIVVYEIDEETKLISSIKLTLPNSEIMKLQPVEDLTEFISMSEFEVTAEDVEPIKQDLFTDTIFSGDFGDYHGEEDLPKEVDEDLEG